MTYRDNYLDLDPTYKDAYGQPLLRMTFDWKDNEIRMSRYVTEHMRKIAEAMNPKAISVSVKNFGDHFNTRVYQTTHLLGGRSWAAIRRPACSTATCRAGTCTTSSSWAPRPSPGHRLQPHWAGGGAGLLVGQGDPRAIPEEPRSAGAGMRSATMKPTAFLALSALACGIAQAAAAPDPTLVRQGEYLARAGDCVACHTARDGKPFAGACRWKRRSARCTRPTSPRTARPASATTASRTSTAPCATAWPGPATPSTRRCPTRPTRESAKRTCAPSTPTSCMAWSRWSSPTRPATSPGRCRCAGRWHSGAGPSLPR